MLRSLLRGALFDYIFLKDFCISILLSAIDYKEISEFEGNYNYKIYLNDIKMKCRLEAITLNKREKDEIDFIAMLY